jgi:hypothetical protein
MELLGIRLTKRMDGGSVLRCVRADGSVTWQKQDRHAAFFALHDLTHFAVESTLGFRDGFFGLVAQGWDIDDTTGKGTRGRLPAETIEVEQMVGLLTAERAGGVPMTAEEFNRFAASQLASLPGYSPRGATEEELQRVRTRCSELFWQWHELPSGSRLELHLGK